MHINIIDGHEKDTQMNTKIHVGLAYTQLQWKTGIKPTRVTYHVGSKIKFLHDHELAPNTS